MPGENNGIGSSTPAVSLLAETPWRTISLGSSLKPIVESTVQFDVLDPLYEASCDYRPGRYTWSWILWGDSSMKWDDQVKFIDVASAMGYEYILVDALWDDRLGYDGVEKLSQYAQSKGVNLLLWYNSNGPQSDAPQGPRNVMNNSIRRKRDMAWMKRIGVKGIKVDFFGGDKQQTMQLYEDILSDANDYGLQVIFHGCTLPRGWERLYPNYVASEGALASENVNFTDQHARSEATEMCMHPFCRNAVGSFDWGGVFMNKHFSRDNKSRHPRYTSNVFEMATAITNQTSVNCVALTPNNLSEMTTEEKEFLQRLPTTWEKTQFIDGYPGKFCVIARQNNGRWYVGGLNANEKSLTLTISVPMLAGKMIQYYTDTPRKGDTLPKTVMTTCKVGHDGKLKVTMQSRGGIILVEN